MTRCACSQTKVVGRAKELEDKKDRRESLMGEQEALEAEMKRFARLAALGCLSCAKSAGQSASQTEKGHGSGC